MPGNRASNDGDLVKRWCVAGKGIAVKSCLDMADELLNGRVINIMPDYQPPMTELWLICPSKQSITPAVRILRDEFRTRCRTLLDQLIEAKIVQRA
jgi:DNA-binding transcriptional LysR family regulator